ncbi:hypothetical protein N9S22_01470 [Paracoccaceae bacterium]|nr:hypothetical protein [Paracoccaceae bacterium]
MFGKTRHASRSKRRAAGGYQRMITAQIVPRLRERTSKDRHCEMANADHKGKYLAWWTKDFRILVIMTFYYHFRNKPIGKLFGHLWRQKCPYITSDATFTNQTNQRISSLVFSFV